MKIGWTPARPTVFIDGERDRIEMQSSKIKLYLLMPELSNGIVPWLNQFGTWFYGHYSDRDQYCIRSNCLLDQSVEHLVGAAELKYDNGTLHDLMDIDYNWYYDIKSTCFYMQMMRKSLNETWRWPTLLMWKNDRGIIWENGNSRCAANGILHDRPWEHQKFLYFQPHGVDVNPLSTDCIAIHSDEQLHNLLNLEYKFEFHQPILCSIGIHFQDGTPNFKWIHDGDELGNLDDETVKIWNNFLEWQQNYSNRPSITVVTKTPELITDRHNAWRITIVDDSVPTGKLHLSALREHNARTIGTSHVLWYTGDAGIDLGDLLFWVDMNHSLYVDIKQQFVLYRHARDFISRDVSVRRMR
jgi:hypothetical protein